MVTVFIVASIRILEDTLREAITAKLSFTVVGAAAATPAALLAIQDLDRPPDIVLVDADASQSIDTTRLIATALPAVRLVCLGLDEEPGEVINWAEAGVAGFVSSQATLDDLVRVLGAVAEGESPCSPRVAATLLRRVASLAGEPHREPPLASLTARERQIAWLVAEGLPNKEISRRLHIQLGTVKNHVHSLIRKLGAAGRGQAAAMLRAQSQATPSADEGT